MAIWQFLLIFVPEQVLLRKYDILPLELPTEFADNFPWWSEVQTPADIEQQIDRILPRTDSQSPSLRMWGQDDWHDACLCYVDESREIIDELVFRVDLRVNPDDMVRDICKLARKLGCVLMTDRNKILAPDESMVLTALSHSTAGKFVVDPIATLRNLDVGKFRVKYPRKLPKKDPPIKE